MKPKIYVAQGVDAHKFLREVLAQNGVFDAKFVYGEQGKPYLKSGELYFNLSHCDGMAVCGVADREIGVDVQRIKHRPRVARKVCTAEELAQIETAEDFTRAWVLKESYAKCDGRGLSLGLKNINTLSLKNSEVWRIGDFLVAACYNID